jgi:erythritol transport system ATP-binding protein
VAIVYISHHLEEALEICDHAVVFRDGELVAVADRDEIDINWVIGKMVGRDFSDLAPDLPQQPGAPVLEMQDVLVADPANPSRLAVNGFSLTVHAGEIVALYGLMGAGRTELLEALAGRRPVAAGKVLLNGADVAKLSVRERISAGIALVPEDRQRDGLAQNLSVASNISLASITRFVRFSLIQRVRERARVSELIANLRVKASSPDAPVTSLSGGNQQKVVIGKVMMTDPKVLLLDEPTRGIDVGAKAEIFQLMADGAKSGLAVLFATSEVNEALLSANRVIVVSKGRIVREFDPAVAAKEDLMIASGESESTTAGPADPR